jgi:hypothetical protein
MLAINFIADLLNLGGIYLLAIVVEEGSISY